MVSLSNHGGQAYAHTLRHAQGDSSASLSFTSLKFRWNLIPRKNMFLYKQKKPAFFGPAFHIRYNCNYNLPIS